jgi:hypothetical protein
MLRTKPRKFSYSANDLDKSGINDTKVEQILAKKPGTTINIQELVRGELKYDCFINKLVPKSVCQKLEEKYVTLVMLMVVPGFLARICSTLVSLIPDLSKSLAE